MFSQLEIVRLLAGFIGVGICGEILSKKRNNIFILSADAFLCVQLLTWYWHLEVMEHIKLFGYLYIGAVGLITTIYIGKIFGFENDELVKASIPIYILIPLVASAAILYFII